MKKRLLNRVLPRNAARPYASAFSRLNSIFLTLTTVIAFMAFAEKGLAQQQTSSLPPEDAQLLPRGQSVRKRSEANKTHLYRLDLKAGEFARIDVDQRGVDVRLTVKTPDGSLYRDIDNPNGLYGPETVSILAIVAGSYAIELSADSRYPPGDYELRVQGSDQASSSESARVAAEQLFFEAQVLRREQKYNEAINKYNEALLLFRQLGDLREQSYSLTNMARACRTLAQFTDPLADTRDDLFNRAINHFREALAPLQSTADISGQAFVLNEIGSAYRDFGDPKQALESYETALKLRLDFGDRIGQAQLYNNIGLTYSYMGAQPTALQNYAKALPIWRELRVRHDEMNTRANEAKANAEMGESATALSQFQEVLAYCDEQLAIKDSPLTGSANYLKPFALNGIGLVYSTWDNPDEARDHYQQALELFRKNGNRRSEVDVLDNLGLLHAELGDTTRALTYFQDALIIRRQLKDPKGLGITLSNLGLIHVMLKKNQEALHEFDQALPLNRKAGDRRFEAYTLVWIGMVHAALNEPVKAIEHYEKALTIQQDPLFIDLRGQAITLDRMGQALASSGNLAEASKRYNSALERWTAIRDAQGEALTLQGLAQVERDRQNLANARDFAEKAIGIVERLRHRVSGYKLQTTYFAEKQDLYALGIDVRMRLHALTNSAADLEAALSLSEQARARNLLDVLARGRIELDKTLSAEDADKNVRLEQQIVQLTQNLLRLRSTGQNKDAAVVEEKVAARIKDQEDLLRSARASKSHGFDRRQAQPLSPKEIQQLLDDDALLLQFSLDEKRSHLWAVTRTKIDHFDLPGRSEIENTATQLRQALTDREARRAGESEVDALSRRRTAPARYRQSAADLSRLILNGVATQLGNKRLVIVADGALHYIPFEALPLPDSVVPAQPASANAQRPLLLQSNEIVYQPSASALAMLRRARRPVASNRVAVLADPVFASQEINGARGKDGSKPVQLAKAKLARSLRDIGDTGSGDYSLQRLEFSLREANAIAAVAPRGSIKAVGFKATRALATSPLLKQFGFVHFATHGLLNDKNPELSGIVFSMVNERGEPEDGYLTLRDIYNLDLPTHLVVASACETGIGRSVRGEGLIGLTRGFMNAGARSVVVSLWRVEDEATAELMKRFYSHMFGKPGMTPAAALRQAKMEMKDLHHPYQWAGFVLQGDWK